MTRVSIRVRNRPHQRAIESASVENKGVSDLWAIHCVAYGRPMPQRMTAWGHVLKGSAERRSHQERYDSGPRLPKLAWPLRPITRWSWMAMPRASAAVLISRVISMSSREDRHLDDCASPSRIQGDGEPACSSCHVRFGSRASPSAINGCPSTSAILRLRPKSCGGAKCCDGPIGDICSAANSNSTMIR
jgi:hypothetical protein